MNPYYAVIAERANHRCEYCQAPEVVFNFPFEVEHIIPISRQGEQHVEWTPAVKRVMQEIEDGSGSAQISERKLTKQELYDRAKALNISGRSKMSHKELQAAIEQTKHNDT